MGGLRLYPKYPTCHHVGKCYKKDDLSLISVYQEVVCHLCNRMLKNKNSLATHMTLKHKRNSESNYYMIPNV